MNAPLPLVSVVIPAYNERFFGEAFASALAQSWPALEVVVCDDSPGGDIESIVRAAADPRARHVRNPQRLGFARNFSRCLELAQGEYVKFLNDDDRLRPRCVETLVNVMRANPGVRLAASRRIVIDAQGRPAPDILATTPVSHVSALMLGRELGDFMLVNGTNFLGEPSTALFRRADLAIEDGLVFRWGGRDYHCLADMSLWLRLLAKGLAYYEAGVLSEFRMHPGQEQQGMDFECAAERLWIARQARTAGFLVTPMLWRTALAAVIARAEALRDATVYAPEMRERALALIDEARAELQPPPGAAPQP
ncbi:MAG TPA: glycosyltransferase family 2 protein [Usitatibacter sp.]|jgi:glycosyltransferase involved in cell wall biosynthesis|nr:glycosyltransferase family 2 protein [Usitatibacter sp.]